MTQLKLRARVLSVIAAAALVPASAFAQSAGSDTSHGATDQPSQSGSQSGSQTQNGNQPVPSPSQSAQSGQSGSTSASAAARTSTSPSAQPSQQGSTGMNRSTHIDPAEVQKVFGSDVGLIDLASLSPEQVRSLQQTLADRGFYQGEIDGVIGAQTRSAVSTMLAQQFALTQRLINQNKITESLASSIGLASTDLAPVRGVDPSQNMMQPQGQGQSSGSMQQGTQQRSNASGTRSGSSSSGSMNTGSGTDTSSSSSSSNTGSSSRGTTGNSSTGGSSSATGAGGGR